MMTDPFTYHLQVKGMVGKRVVGKRGYTHDGDDGEDGDDDGDDGDKGVDEVDNDDDVMCYDES